MKKLLTSLLALTTITTPILTVTACNINKQPNNNYDYDIAVDINKVIYNLNVSLLDTQANIKTQLTAKFIKAKLDPKLQSNFIDSKLTINNITCDKHDLTPQDLNQVKQVDTLLSLNYGLIKVETQLQLQVNDQYQMEVIKAIKSANYQYINDTKSTLNDFTKTINLSFIESQLTQKIKTEFRKENFQILGFEKDSQPLNDNDFKTEGKFYITINFKYYAIKDSCILILILNPTEINQLVNSINNTVYSKTLAINSTVKDLTNTLDANFIKTRLKPEFQVKFKPEDFKLIKLINKITDKDLNNSDLKIVTNLDTIIQFNYANIAGQSNLELNLIADDNTKITEAITNTVYSKTITVNSSVTDLKQQITSEFIKDKLLEPFKSLFQDKEYLFKNLINQSTKKELVDTDLINPNNLDILIQFSYHGIIGQTALNLNIVKNSDVMLEAIENINLKYFYVTVPYGDGANYFTADFIKQQLSVNLQEKFQADNYKFIKMEWTGFDDGKLYYNYKLHFSYNNEIGVLPIFQATDLFSRFLSDPNIAKLEIKSNSTIKDLTDVFWADFKKYVFANTDPKYKNDFEFVINTFQFQLMAFTRLNGQELTDKDLATKGTISVYCAFIVQNIPTMMPFQIIIN